MPTYSFVCKSKRHEGNSAPREFSMVLPYQNVDQYRCPACTGMAKRDVAGDIKSVNTTGMTPIAVSESKFSIAKEIEFAAGQFKQNPDGSKDMNHAPFRDTGEMQKWMDGHNQLGDPVVKDDGSVLRRKDGSIVRQGAKLFKYGKSSAPSKDGVKKPRPRASTPSIWCSEKATGGSSGGIAPRRGRVV